MCNPLCILVCDINTLSMKRSLLGVHETIIPHYVCEKKGCVHHVYKKPFDVGKESIAKDIHNYIRF